MLKEILERTIWKILKKNNYKMTISDENDIWFVKRYSDELAYYVRCNRIESQKTIYVTFYFTAIQVPDSRLATTDIGLKIEIGYSGEAGKTLEAAGEKIVAIENNLGDVAEVIMDELEEPYFMLAINEPYNENMVIYEIIDGNESLQTELKELKCKGCECLREGDKEKLQSLCSAFIDKVPDRVWEEEKICFDKDKTKNCFAEQIFAQCVLDA